MSHELTKCKDSSKLRCTKCNRVWDTMDVDLAATEDCPKGDGNER